MWRCCHLLTSLFLSFPLFFFRKYNINNTDISNREPCRHRFIEKDPTCYSVPGALSHNNRLAVFSSPSNSRGWMARRPTPQCSVLALGYGEIAAGIVVYDIRRNWNREKTFRLKQDDLWDNAKESKYKSKGRQSNRGKLDWIWWWIVLSGSGNRISGEAKVSEDFVSFYVVCFKFCAE